VLVSGEFRTIQVEKENSKARGNATRMPVVLEPGEFEPRLSLKAGVEFLKPAANDVRDLRDPRLIQSLPE
jgi:hypothetical protein